MHSLSDEECNCNKTSKYSTADNMYLRIAEWCFFFALSDFIRFCIDSIEHIDDLFVVRISTITSSQLFFKLIITQEKHVLNSILNISVFELSEFDCVVDFLNINSARSYLISVISSDSDCALQLWQHNDTADQESTEQELLMISWSVQYL